jgi:hypothetical protein
VHKHAHSNQHAHPPSLPLRSIGIVSGKSELNSPTSSWASACRAMTASKYVRDRLRREFLDITFESLFDVDGFFGTRLKVRDATF